MSVYVIKYEPNPHLKPLLIGPLTDEQAREQIERCEATFARNFDPPESWTRANIVDEGFVEQLKESGQLELFHVTPSQES